MTEQQLLEKGFREAQGYRVVMPNGCSAKKLISQDKQEVYYIVHVPTACQAESGGKEHLTLKPREFAEFRQGTKSKAAGKVKKHAKEPGESKASNAS